MSVRNNSPLGQMHQGQMQTHLSHPFHRFIVKSSFLLNATFLSVLCGLFAIKKIFPPHDAAFKWAIGSYFIFGIIYAVFAFLFFKFASLIEMQAVTKALTQNRRYEWHAQYDTANMTEEEMKKMSETKNTTIAPPVNAGSRYFRVTVLLAIASFCTCATGLYTFFAEFMATE